MYLRDDINEATGIGGAGNDIFNLSLSQLGLFSSRYVITAGDGDDVVVVGNGGLGFNLPRNQIDLGAGNDRVMIVGFAHANVTLGAGADVVQLGLDRGDIISTRISGRAILNDYVIGQDRVELYFQVATETNTGGPQRSTGTLLNWDGAANLFATGHLRLVQDGTTARLELDRDGPSGPFGYDPLLEFANTQISALTAADLGGYAPDGSTPVGRTLTGTEGSDTATGFLFMSGSLIGGAGNDTINGLGGNDVIFGYAGNDTIYGGSGDDRIFAGHGNDFVDGGDGNDFINSGAGASRLYGGAGSDSLLTSLDLPGHSILDGGDGNDSIGVTFSGYSNAPHPEATARLFGGAGNDSVFFNELIREVVVDLGTGNDTMLLFGNQRTLLTLGAGADRIDMSGFRQIGFAAGVRDFQIGADTVSLPSGPTSIDGLFQPFFQNLATGANPFASGHARLAQWGDDTLLQFDRDGGGDNYFTAVIFSGVLPSAFTAAEFRGMAPASGFVYLSQPADMRGTGVAVNFETSDPAVYQSAMRAIRDFEGYNLGGNGSWLRIGSADINGDGDIDQILVNDAIGRFATVGTASDGLVYFSDHRWGGETRVAGIYIDPLVAAGIVQAGSAFDSQRRFQNDLEIENINRVLGADDYNDDGIHEVYFALTDGTAYLRALMHEDGNIRYANYQSQQEVIDYLTANGFGQETWGAWFNRPSEGEVSAMQASTMQERVDIAEANGLGRAGLALMPGLDAALPGTINPATLAFNAPALDDHMRAEFYG